MTKSLTIALFIIFILLQYKLWFDKDGILSVWHLRELTQHQMQINAEIKTHNQVLEADVKSLKKGQEAIEERARHDLGMIKKDEVFIGFNGEKS